MIIPPVAASLMDWLKQFPAAWAIIGALITALVGGVVFILVWRRIAPTLNKMTNRVGESSDALVDLQKKQLDTVKETAKIQADANAASMQMQKDHYESELAECRQKAERDVAFAVAKTDEYEKQLHDKRNEWNNEKLQMTQQIVELQARPNVETLFEFESKAEERRSKFYTELSDVMKQQGDALTLISSAIREHDSKIEARMHKHDESAEKRMQAVVQPVIEGMNKVVAAINGKVHKRPDKKKKPG